MDLARLQPSSFTALDALVDADLLWAVVADPTAHPAVSPELQAVRLNGPVGLGSTFEGDQQRGERSWTTVSTITAFEPGHLFEWTVGDLANPVSVWRIVMSNQGDHVTIAEKVTLCGGPSPLSAFIADRPDEAIAIVSGRLQTLTERMNQTLAGLVELAGGTVR